MSVSNSEIEGLIQKISMQSKSSQDDNVSVCLDEDDSVIVLACLKELKDWRYQADERGEKSPYRIIVEGFSEECMKEAFADAMQKAARYYSETHDVSVTVLGLKHLPKGGHHVTLEVHITPLNMVDVSEPDAALEEIKKSKDRDYRKAKIEHEIHLKHLVQDHFLMESGAAPDIPDSLMIRVDDAALLNKMIEKEFFKAGHEIKPKDNSYVIRYKYKDGAPELRDDIS